VGGAPGEDAAWLAGRGYTVRHRDVIPLHVEQLAEAARARDLVLETAVADARELDLADSSADAVLPLGPLYHLITSDRLRALAEARRILRAGGPAFVAAISRWAARLHGVVVSRLYERIPDARAQVAAAERTTWCPPLFPGSFTAYAHRPHELRAELLDAGLECVDIVSVEGIAFALGDLDERRASSESHAVALEAARAVERVPELLGIGPHLLATARRSV
jgi:SAM-dependent methyltransferase